MIQHSIDSGCPSNRHDRTDMLASMRSGQDASSCQSSRHTVPAAHAPSTFSETESHATLLAIMENTSWQESGLRTRTSYRGVRPLAKGLLAAVVQGLVAFALSGCGEKVDCHRLCDREAECFPEIAVATGAATREQTALLKEGDRKAFGKKQKRKCLSNCTSPTKPSSVHTKWRGCLAAESCEAFAMCVYR